MDTLWCEIMGPNCRIPRSKMIFYLWAYNDCSKLWTISFLPSRPLPTRSDLPNAYSFLREEVLIFYSLHVSGPEAGCGGTLEQASGTITSVDADNDGKYENNLECDWRIIVGKFSPVVFIYINMDRCLWDPDKYYFFSISFPPFILNLFPVSKP